MSVAPEEETRQLAIRLPASLVGRLEDHVVRMRRATPGVDVRRADALRSLLIEALERAETNENTSKK